MTDKKQWQVWDDTYMTNTKPLYVVRKKLLHLNKMDVREHTDNGC